MWTIQNVLFVNKELFYLLTFNENQGPHLIALKITTVDKDYIFLLSIRLTNLVQCQSLIEKGVMSGVLRVMSLGHVFFSKFCKVLIIILWRKIKVYLKWKLYIVLKIKCYNIINICYEKAKVKYLLVYRYNILKEISTSSIKYYFIALKKYFC